MITLNVVTTFVTIFTIIDPFGLIPIYLGVSSDLKKSDRKKAVFFSGILAMVICSLFLFFGKSLLHALGLSFESFYVAGGILLFLIALDMLYARTRKTKQDDEDIGNEGHSSDFSEIAVFPLAIPMLAGPGTIATIIMFSSQAKTRLDLMVILASFVVSLLISMVMMIFSDSLFKVLKRTGLNVIDRLMGMILAAMAVQFIINAFVNLGVLIDTSL